jgi:hypothetical protein
MLPQNYLSIKGKHLKPDMEAFLRGVLLALINILHRQGITTKDVEFLGTNDIHTFRGTDIVILSLSRSRYLIEPQFTEFPLAEILPSEKDIIVEQPVYHDSADWRKYLENLGCTAPISIAMPISYLALKGDELEAAHAKVAQLLLGPTQEDLDRKNRIARVNPIFSGREFLVERDLCFVLMEFKPPYTDIFDHLIKPTVELEGFRCIKSNDIFSMTSVIEDIWANINKATLVIAEISGNNPNVMYELGICHTVGKNVMMITQNPDKIPFNFRHMRCYPYSNDIPGGDELKKNIRSILGHLKSAQ